MMANTTTWAPKDILPMAIFSSPSTGSTGARGRGAGRSGRRREWSVGRNELGPELELGELLLLLLVDFGVDELHVLEPFVVFELSDVIRDAHVGRGHAVDGDLRTALFELREPDEVGKLRRERIEHPDRPLALALEP